MSWALANQEMPSKHGRRLRGDWGNGPQSLRWGTAHAYVPQYLGNTLGIYKPDYDQQPPRGLSLYFRQSRPTFETINNQNGHQEFWVEILAFLVLKRSFGNLARKI